MVRIAELFLMGVRLVKPINFVGGAYMKLWWKPLMITSFFEWPGSCQWVIDVFFRLSHASFRDLLSCLTFFSICSFLLLLFLKSPTKLFVFCFKIFRGTNSFPFCLSIPYFFFLKGPHSGKECLLLPLPRSPQELRHVVCICLWSWERHVLGENGLTQHQATAVGNNGTVLVRAVMVNTIFRHFFPVHFSNQ